MYIPLMSVYKMQFVIESFVCLLNPVEVYASFMNERVVGMLNDIYSVKSDVGHNFHCHYHQTSCTIHSMYDSFVS